MIKLISITDYADTVVSKIKQHYSWARLNNCTYCIKTNKSTEQIRDELSMLGNGVMVIDITNSTWKSYLIDQQVTEWLKNDNCNIL